MLKGFGFEMKNSLAIKRILLFGKLIKSTFCILEFNVLEFKFTMTVKFREVLYSLFVG